MSFVVSARKYRPQNFDEVIGQDHVAQTLKRAMENDQLAHAFLFAGPRGVGKTTSARILAKVLNCENLQDGYKACGECKSCKAFLDNASFNIFELDAASNNSVEHIRALNEQVRFQPQQGAYKIYIIDEVHMLSQAAFNAFLKTLEEPPPYAKFILATTEKHKIIPTILSRCQIFDFKRIQIGDIVSQLKEIVEKEERKIDDDALHLVAQKADGAMRDALSIYDKIISSVDGDISYKDVADNLNVLDYDYYFRMADAMIKEDVTEAMMINNEIIKQGFESEQFILGLMTHLRDLMMVKDVRTASILDIAESLKSRYEQQALLASNSFLLSALSLLNEVDINLPRSQNKRLSVEIALSKICYLNRLIDKKKTELAKPKSEAKTIATPAIKADATTSNSKNETDQVSDNQSDKRTDRKNDISIPSPEKSKESQLKAEEKQDSETKPIVSESIQKSSKPLQTNVGTDDNTSANKPMSKGPKTPTISTDINLLLNGGLAGQKAKKVQMPLTLEGLQSLFDNYKEKTTSPSVKTAIQNIKIEIAKTDIRILSPTQIYLDFIRQESALVELLHENYSNSYDKIIYRVSESTFPDYKPPKKPQHLSTIEKYDMLSKKNPHFNKLVEEFNLKLTNH